MTFALLVLCASWLWSGAAIDSVGWGLQQPAGPDVTLFRCVDDDPRTDRPFTDAEWWLTADPFAGAGVWGTETEGYHRWSGVVRAMLSTREENKP